ncbi:MAG: SAM-dependent methyltransferase [Candidatus Promineifilaceae bacterium]
MAAQTFTDDHYNTLYGDQASTLYQTLRAASYGEEWGQAGWSHSSEIDLFLSWLPLNSETALLDFGCGAGGVSLRAAVTSGCRVHGIDISEQGIANAQLSAENLNLHNRVTFAVADVGQPSQLPSEQFDLLICMDAITDMPNRPKLLADWYQTLKPGGIALYVDCLVMAGQLNSSELSIRSGTGYNVYTPQGVNEQMIANAGFTLLRSEDATDGLIAVADGWVKARDRHAAELIAIEGQLRFDQDQTFHRLAVKLAQERRVLRTAFLIQKPVALSK